ncbi:hypothetical protein L208DRAFT_574977 [Tricholoma matsutake]|nr:hypothetical protein L208DRAFT_574977 [Tricholoma matsutake 945]
MLIQANPLRIAFRVNSQRQNPISVSISRDELWPSIGDGHRNAIVTALISSCLLFYLSGPSKLHSFSPVHRNVVRGGDPSRVSTVSFKTSLV